MDNGQTSQHLRDSDRLDSVALRDEWESVGGNVKTPDQQSRCAVTGCRTMPFALLSTKLGTHPVCLLHFEEVTSCPSRRLTWIMLSHPELAGHDERE